MPTDYVSREKRYCEVCGIYIIKKKGVSWKNYSKRKYHDQKCTSEAKKVSGDRMNPNSTDRTDVSDYIELKSKNGRLMADFNLGVLQAVEKVGADKKLSRFDNGKVDSTICTYKGVPVTGEVVKAANQWLMDNWKGKPGQRSDKVDEPEMSREELVMALDVLQEDEVSDAGTHAEGKEKAEA